MARIINTRRISLQEKYEAIKPIVNWAYFDRKKGFKRIKSVSDNTKRKITKVYKTVILETGLPYKSFTIKKAAHRHSAMEKYNPTAPKGMFRKPFINATSNQNTEIRFKGKSPYLYNRHAGAITEIYKFGARELKGDFQGSIDWLQKIIQRPGKMRGQIITANSGDIFPSRNIAGENYEPEDIEGYYQKIRALYDRYPEAGKWIDSLQVIRFVDKPLTKKKRKRKGKNKRRKKG